MRESDQIIVDFPKMVLSPGGEFAPYFKPHCGFFLSTPDPIVGHLQLFQKKMTNTRGEWARLELTEP